MKRMFQGCRLLPLDKEYLTSEDVQQRKHKILSSWKILEDLAGASDTARWGGDMYL